MLIDTKLIEASIARTRRWKRNVDELRAIVSDGDRSSWVTTEQRQRRFKNLLAETRNAERANQTLERLIGGNDLMPVNYLERGTLVARSVCRIHLRDSSGNTVGFGTGFLVGPGVLMTNHHVIGGVNDARGALAEFNYELDASGQEKSSVTFEIQANPAPIAIQQLDFCLVGVASRSVDGKRSLEEFGWLALDAAPGKAVIGEYLTIIQHPGGERKQVCVRENKLLKYDESGNTLWYQTDTVAGSSGSPVFNNSWQVVALHHSGIPDTDEQGRWLTVDGKVWDSSMDESRVKWIANEGMRISQIASFLSEKFSTHPLAEPVLNSKRSPIIARPNELSQNQSSHYENGELRVTIPIQVAVRVGNQGGTPTPRALMPSPTAPLSPKTPSRLAYDQGGIEKVDVDQSNYDERTGYDPKFLGGGSLVVPLPVIRDSTLKEQVLAFTVGRREIQALKYWNYSVVMHKSRRLAIFSAVNVDANLRPENSNREGDRWFYDARIGEKDQIGAEFYKAQREFEVDRSANPFDRGHLTRRMDAQWGADEEAAKRNGDDSFHWTNCSPQHWQFNQGKKRWLGLEDYVISEFAKDSGRACVINGPIFDAPLSHMGAGERVVLNLQGESHKDPKFGGIAIPKLFYKVVACVRSGNKLAVAAFIMSQEDFLMTTDRLTGMPIIEEERLAPSEAHLYQVKLADIESLTGLDFGTLGDADVGAQEGIMLERPRIIERLQDIHLNI